MSVKDRLEVLDEADKAYLKRNGAWEAYEGTRAWESKLKCCYIAGAEVRMTPQCLAEFSQAPPSVRDQLQTLERQRLENYSRLLQGKIAGAPAPHTDPRPGPEDPNNGVPVVAVELAGPESEAQLRQTVKIILDVKCFDCRAISLLVAEDGNAWLLFGTKEQAQVIAKGTTLAGVGAGKVAKLDETDASGFVPVAFPKQDKTAIEAALSDVDAESEAKLKKGTFYVVAKEVLKAHPADKLYVTGHDVTIRPATEGQTHGFDIVKQADTWGFQVKDKQVANWTPGNAAKQIVDKKLGLHNAVGWLWRFAFEKVHSKLTAKKPFLVLLEDIKMQPGKPVKITAT